MNLFTIGHSNLDIATFIALLQKYGVTALVDVRSHPYSKYLPHFNHKELKFALQLEKISYVFLGKELGARPSDRNCYVEGKALYAKIAATDLFKAGIERIVNGIKTYNIALMCAEKDPITCHRTILICQYLRSYKLEINHILQDGSLETHQHLEDRLLSLHNLVKPPKSYQLSLFDQQLNLAKSLNAYSIEAAINEAYRRQGDKIAYVEKQGEPYE